jgi:hypothetical protein
MSDAREHDASEFLPLPYFPWLSRPETLPLDLDEVATALYLAKGNLTAAAALLKVSPARLNRVVRGSPRLVRLKAELQRHRSAVSAGS